MQAKHNLNKAFNWKRNFILEQRKFNRRAFGKRCWKQLCNDLHGV